eukprot:gene8263-88_t
MSHKTTVLVVVVFLLIEISLAEWKVTNYRQNIPANEGIFFSIEKTAKEIKYEVKSSSTMDVFLVDLENQKLIREGKSFSALRFSRRTTNVNMEYRSSTISKGIVIYVSNTNGFLLPIDLKLEKNIPTRQEKFDEWWKWNSVSTILIIVLPNFIIGIFLLIGVCLIPTLYLTLGRVVLQGTKEYSGYEDPNDPNEKTSRYGSSGVYINGVPIQSYGGVGGIMDSYFDENDCYCTVNSFYAKPTEQNKGIGSLLVKQLLEKTEKLRIDRI